MITGAVSSSPDARVLDRVSARRREQTPQALARLVVIGLFIGLWTLLWLAHIPMPVPFLALLCCEAAFFLAYWRGVTILRSVRQIELAHYFMLAAEVVFHTTMVYFLGGVAWLGAFAYVFGLIFTNTFLDMKRGLIYTTGAALAFLTLVLLEATGVLPYYTYLQGGPASYRDGQFVVTTGAGAAGVFYSIYLWVNWVGRQLRIERDTAVRAQDDLLAVRAKLQEANTELEARVAERTGELEQANAALQANEEILRNTIESTTDGLLAMCEGSLVHTNALFREIWHVPNDVIDRRDNTRLAELISRQLDDAEGFLDRLRTLYVTANEHYEALHFKDGRVIESYSRPLLRDGGVIGRVWSFRDVTERKRAEAVLRERAECDALTGTLNHAAITDVVRDLIARTGDEGVGFTVAMVDVDGMKATNDIYGHQAGDAALAAVATALERDGAVVGRYGGDEFVAVLPGADRSAAERYRDRVKADLAQRPVPVLSKELRVPVVISMGFAVYPTEAEGVEDLIKLADSAMYALRREERAPVAAGSSAARSLGGEREARMVGEIMPLLTSPGSPEDKLRLVARQLSIGAGYDFVNFEVFDPDVLGASFGAASDAHFSAEALKIGAAWLKERHILSEHPALGPILKNSRLPVILEDVSRDERLTPLEHELARATNARSGIIVPMFWQEEFVGVLSVWSGRTRAFSSRDAQFLTAVAGQVTAIVRMAATSTRLERAHVETVIMLAAAAEAHDAMTGRHLQRVRAISEAIAREVGYGEQAAAALGLAAVLHDIGKIRMPDALLSSAQRLDRDERSIMQRHTVWGAEFLRGRPGFELAAEVAQAHHEWWDGTGYPFGLAGEAIPEAATIVAVADCFDAMTNDRPYRSGRPASAAVREIEAWSGAQFSPQVVQAFVRLWQRGALPTEVDEGLDEQDAAA